MFVFIEKNWVIEANFGHNYFEQIFFFSYELQKLINVCSLQDLVRTSSINTLWKVSWMSSTAFTVNFSGNRSKFGVGGRGRNHPKLSKWVSKPSIRRFELLKNPYGISSPKMSRFRPSPPGLHCICLILGKKTLHVFFISNTFFSSQLQCCLIF